jgi:thiol-disulfide isomerase/thioredoxin
MLSVRRRLRGAQTLFLVMFALVAGTHADEVERRAMTLWDQPMPVPSFRFTDDAGRSLNLEDFQGKIVLLNVWATWCAPCRKEMPTLDRLSQELGGREFQVVPLAIDRAGVEAVRRFYDKTGISGLGLYVDTASAATRALKLDGLPTTLLIDRKGQEIGRITGPAEWDSPQMVGLIKSFIASPSNQLQKG